MSVDTAEVNRLLAASRAAHDLKKRHAGLVDADGIVTAKPNYPMAEQHVVQALTLRQQAHVLDPGHTADGWSQDRVSDEALIKFYVSYALPHIPEPLMVDILKRFPAYAEIRYIP